MTTIECPHCHTANRKPVCGRCGAQLSDPPEVRFAWALYHYRRPAAAVGVLAFLALAAWQPWHAFGEPQNLLECQEKAARTARSNAAMHILLTACSSRFR